MADIRINDLPEEPTPAASAAVAIDGATTRKTTIENLVAAGRPLASQAEAEAGTNPAKAMTPLTTAQAIAALGASAAQGALANTALQPGDAATPAQGALADTALQPGDALATTVYDPQGKVGDPFPYDTKALAEAATISANVHTIKLNGYTTVGDGIGGIYVDADNGSSDTITSADARTWYRVRDIDPRRIAFPRGIKGLVISDVQPYNDNETMKDLADQVFINIGLTHPHFDISHHPGDLVDQGTVDGTGATPAWGFEQYGIAMRNGGLRSSCAYFLPGNHDLNGTGSGAHAKAWSIDEYKRWYGPGFYYTVMGNIVHVYVGDVGGQNSGEVLPDTWQEVFRIAADHKGCNVFLWAHQPMDGVYNGYVYPTNNNAVQASSVLAGLLTAHQAQYGNVVSVYYGHIGSAFNPATSSIDLLGTKHWGGQMAIPSFGLTENPLVYSTYEMAHGGTTVTFKKWNARLVGPDAYLGEASDVVVTLKYPLDIGDGKVDFDGRHALPVHRPIMEENGKVRASLADFVAETSPGSGSYAVPDGTIARMFTLEVNDDNNSAPGGFGLGIAFNLPGSVGETLDGSNNVITPGSKEAGLLTISRIVSADQLDFQSRFNLHLLQAREASTSPGALLDVLEVRGQSSGVSGLQLKQANSCFRVSSDNDYTNWTASNTAAKVIVNAVGTVYAARNGSGSIIQRLGTDGYLQELYRDATRIGGIQGVNGTARFLLTPNIFIGVNAGSPEGVISGAIGSVIFDLTNGVQYNKKTGTGNTGWKLVTQAA